MQIALSIINASWGNLTSSNAKHNHNCYSYSAYFFFFSNWLFWLNDVCIQMVYSWCIMIASDRIYCDWTVIFVNGGNLVNLVRYEASIGHAAGLAIGENKFLLQERLRQRIHGGFGTRADVQTAESIRPPRAYGFKWRQCNPPEVAAIAWSTSATLSIQFRSNI